MPSNKLRLTRLTLAASIWESRQSHLVSYLEHVAEAISAAGKAVQRDWKALKRRRDLDPDVRQWLEDGLADNASHVEGELPRMAWASTFLFLYSILEHEAIHAVNLAADAGRLNGQLPADLYLMAVQQFVTSRRNRRVLSPVWSSILELRPLRNLIAHNGGSTRVYQSSTIKYKTQVTESQSLVATWKGLSESHHYLVPTRAFCARVFNVGREAISSLYNVL